MSDSDFLYSAKSNAFVLKESALLKTDDYSDAVPVDMGVFSEFYPTIKDGKRRIAGSDGLPAWEEIPSPPKEELLAQKIALAESKRSELIASANAYISYEQWPSRLMLGRLSDDDKTDFNKWLDYIDELKKIQFTDEEALLNNTITWPAAPATVA